MIHPTRTNLLLLKDKSRSVKNSIGILKARKQALIREFLAATLPFLRSREDIRQSYGKGLRELALALGHEGRDSIESIVVATERDFGIEVIEKSIWGLKYKDIVFHDAPTGTRSNADTTSSALRRISKRGQGSLKNCSNRCSTLPNMRARSSGLVKRSCAPRDGSKCSRKWSFPG
jgi:vacuolar-type H+-ATPase subunit D/Vma8